jgi:hypothetical protein
MTKIRSKVETFMGDTRGFGPLPLLVLIAGIHVTLWNLWEYLESRSSPRFPTIFLTIHPLSLLQSKV